MKKGKFKTSGVLYCRGEQAFKYDEGDQVAFCGQFNEKLIQVLVLEGEANGQMVYLDESMIEFED